LREVAERQWREEGASEQNIYDLASYRFLANKHVEWIKGNGVGSITKTITRPLSIEICKVLGMDRGEIPFMSRDELYK
jgi:hypothetical protein